MKKISLAVAILSGVLFSQVVSAAAVVPTAGSPVTQTWPAQGAAQLQTGHFTASQQNPNSMYVMPCSQINSGANNLYQMPCGLQPYTLPNRIFNSDLGAWFALMFVLTVMLVWVVLLLLIGVLWQMLNKHHK